MFLMKTFQILITHILGNTMKSISYSKVKLILQNRKMKNFFVCTLVTLFDRHASFGLSEWITISIKYLLHD